MTVTEPIATAAAARPAGHALLPAIRRMLPDAAGRVALLLPRSGPLTAAPHHRRAVRLLLAEATLPSGGQVFETAAGELLLLGASRAAAAHAAAILARLDEVAPPLPEPWRLPEDASALLTWAETASLAPPVPPPGPAVPLPGLAELDARLAALPPERVLRRGAILLHAPGGAAPMLAARRLLLSRAALEAELGPALAADPDLLRHAEDRLAARVPPLVRAEPPTLPLLLPLPLDAPPPPAPRPGLIGVLPLAAAVLPGGGLAERRVGLAASGWAMAVGGLEAHTLRLLPPAALGADLLLLRWSPALDARASRAALRELPPPRLVLTGCDGPEALDWGRAAGLAHFAGPYVEDLLASTRTLACPSAAGCTARLCADRAAATGAEGQAGCRNPGLLAAAMPPVPPA